VISFDEAILVPLIQRVIVATLDRLDRDRQSIGDRLAYSEAEAAALLGIQRHVLRDARLRGEIAGCRIGKGIRYERDELLLFLRRRRGL
jgi:hypothetical protein